MTETELDSVMTTLFRTTKERRRVFIPHRWYTGTRVQQSKSLLNDSGIRNDPDLVYESTVWDLSKLGLCDLVPLSNDEISKQT